ncbi:hypothetical protein L6260_04030 [Candidatus Parcubacteria bacterium]|nr:hypothetical protein [Candidatus Parcubacteria bacterium]
MKKKLFVLAILLVLLFFVSPASARKQLDPADVRVMQEKIADTAMIVGMVGTVIVTILVPWAIAMGLINGFNGAYEKLLLKIKLYFLLAVAIALRNFIGGAGLYLMDYEIPSNWIWI